MTENTKVISPWGRLEVILARKPGKGHWHCYSISVTEKAPCLMPTANKATGHTVLSMRKMGLHPASERAGSEGLNQLCQFSPVV